MKPSTEPEMKNAPSGEKQHVSGCDSPPNLRRSEVTGARRRTGENAHRAVDLSPWARAVPRRFKKDSDLDLGDTADLLHCTDWELAENE